MKILQSLEIILKNYNPEAYENQKKAHEYKKTDIKASANNIRQFLESIVEDIIKREDSTIEISGILGNDIEILLKKGIIDENKKNLFDTARKVGNRGSHAYKKEEVKELTQDEVEDALKIVDELSDFYIKKYLLKDAIEDDILNDPYDTDLPEILEYENYVFQCEKPECRMYMKSKQKLRLCLKCGGPVIYKDVVVNITNGGPSEEDNPKVDEKVPNTTIKIPKRHKFEIYDRTLELVEEVNLTKDEIIVGRKSESFTNVDIDLKDYTFNPEENKYMISRYQAHIYKKDEDYYMQSKSKNADIIINDTKLQCDGELVKLEDKDLIKINEAVAFIYLVY